MTEQSEKIARLNDLCRTAPGVAGKWVYTKGIAALSADARSAIREQVEVFSDFNPYGERDFGSFVYKGNTIFWKIDYYGSDDPSDASQTTRVLTIMLSEEY